MYREIKAIGRIRTGPMTFDGELRGVLWFVDKVTPGNDYMWFGRVLVISVIIVVVPDSEFDRWFNCVLFIIASSSAVIDKSGDDK